MKKPPRFLIIVISILLFLLFVIGGLPVIGGMLYTAVQPVTGFKAYEATAPLNGAEVKEAVLYYTGHDYFPRNYTYKQTYTSGVILYESNYDRMRWVPCGSSTARSRTVYKCTNGTLRTGGNYRIFISRLNDKITSYYVAANIGNTDLWFEIPEEGRDALTSYDGWPEYFTTLKPKSLWFTPYEHRS